MIEFVTIHSIIRALTAIIVLMFLLAFVRIMNSANTLEWSDLISTLGRDGRPHADWDKIGKGLGVVLCVWLPAVYVYSPKMEAVGLAAVLGVVLLYLGGVSAYAATLRSKQGSVTRISEPAPDPSTTKTTVIQTPPIALGKEKENDLAI